MPKVPQLETGQMFGRKILAWPVCWALYWAGHVISKPMHWMDLAGLYPIYNWLMITSYDVQEWGGDDFGPWKYR